MSFATPAAAVLGVYVASAPPGDALTIKAVPPPSSGRIDMAVATWY